MLSTKRSRSSSFMTSRTSAGLAPVVVGPQGVSAAHHVTVGVPARRAGHTFVLGLRSVPLEFGAYTVRHGLIAPRAFAHRPLHA